MVPAYNEEHRLPRTLDAICRYLRSSPGRHAGWEVIVVDDGSTDTTADTVREAAAAEPRIRLLGPPPGTAPAAPFARNHGKGHAVRLGVLASRGRRVLVTDADLATPIEELAGLHDRLDEGYAAAIGSRAHHPESGPAVRRHPLRQLLGEAGNRVIRAVAVPGVRDTQCGFKLFDGDRARAAFGRSRLDGWCIDVEILRMFHGARWPVAEVPVRWAHQPGSKVGALDYARVLRELVRLRAAGALERIRAADRAVVLGYLLVSVVLFHGLWRDPRHRYLIDGGQDQNQWEWFFAVTADNVFALRDPFFTTLQNAPSGVNLMANTTMLGLSVPLAPVTAVFGPAMTWALVLTAGLAATAAAWYWLLLRRFVTSRRAAALGGGLCAFAPAMVSHANAHPNFAVLFMMPLIVDRLLRLCEPGGRTVRDGVILGLFLTYQVFLGEEALLLAALGLLFFAVGYAVVRPGVARAVRGPLLRGSAVAGGVALVLLAYPLYRQFFGAQSYASVLHGPAGNPPGALVEFAGRSLGGDPATADGLARGRTEQNAFFGWPLLALTAVVVVWLWREPRVRALAWTAFATVALSLGRSFPVPGTDWTWPGPWWPLARLPLLESVIESRVAMAAVPALGILLALAVDRLADGSRDRALRIAGWAAIAAALLPVVPTPLTTTDRATVPSFVADGLWRRYLPEGRTLVPVPVPDPAHAEPLHWQTTAGLRFPLAGGYFNGPYGPHRTGIYGPVPRYTSALLSWVERTGAVPEVGPAERRAAAEDLRHWRAGAVVLAPQPADGALRVCVERLLGRPGRWIGGVWVWTVPGRSGEGVSGGT
ncbi:dolichyl-phosphate beta-glucosyltransferase [Streptomyces sp. NA02950]|uniref:dolichyl-phosphate beta-glucosyltransferase n=1 Tax=Streptomyces sp. NA02950 TaxID=2742137 RepID=UPI0020CB2489|nr:dolichyl-phosphate beta-glucosyltransferase [Streptomyces sp. NA02950]